jgi:putative Mg2+ transporter-C (MgtC) family protein
MNVWLAADPPFFGGPGQGVRQIVELFVAFGLTALIGLERELHGKSAGIRTQTIVGTAAALILLVSKYGFSDVLSGHSVVLDPSRVAAQVVSGVGFIGGGLIFVRRDAVRGLTTAGIVWMTAAIGMACGAGLPLLAIAATIGHFIIVIVYFRVALALPRSRYVGYGVRVVYADGRGILRDVLRHCTDAGFTIAEVTTRHLEPDGAGTAPVAVDLEVQGQPRVEPLTTALEDVDGVLEVSSRDLARTSE